LAGYAAFGGVPNLHALVSVLPAAGAMLVLMLCVEFPDVEADRQNGKLNLVARAGRERARIFVYAAISAAYLGAALAIVLGAASTLAIFSALTIPLAWGLVEQLAAGEFADASANADVAARGVAFFVATALGSTLAYVAVA
jgi:1,4-dihydroxy-2-naphthoate octaprenyltransferase